MVQETVTTTQVTCRQTWCVSSKKREKAQKINEFAANDGGRPAGGEASTRGKGTFIHKRQQLIVFKKLILLS